jgi:hypothetical protein
MVLKVLRAFKAHKALLVSKVFKVQLDHKVVKVLHRRVFKDHQDSKEHKDQQVFLAFRDHKV